MTDTTTISTDPKFDPATSELTFFEQLDELTGFDEFAIEKAFAGEIYSLSRVKQFRALAFVSLRRAGLSDKDAKQAVSAMKQRQIADCFADEPDEGDDEQTSAVQSAAAATTDEPDWDSDAGKDESAPE